jgi:plasmid stabilization system protein ParE
MSLGICLSELFSEDVSRQSRWYEEHANGEVAERFVTAVEATLQALAKNPTLGRLRFQPRRALVGIRSFQVQSPYHRHLIFYRFDEEMLIAERAIHGARDLPRRLLRPSWD